jgi:tRNA-intron endonuclease
MDPEEEDEEEVIDTEESKEPLVTIDAIFKNSKVYVNDILASRNLFEKAYFGTKLPDNSFEFDILEAILLLERKRIQIFTETHQIMTQEELFKVGASQDEKIWVKYVIYRDLRTRGYIVRSGYGDGIDFRVYPRGASREEDIAKYFIFILAEGDPIRLDILDRITKQTVQARKELILAIVDRLGDPTYYELEQFKLQMNDKLQAKW